MRPITAAYAAPDTLGWLIRACFAARRLRAPLWAVLTGSWARTFPWPVGTAIIDATGLITQQGEQQIRAFVAAHYAYEEYVSGEPPRSLATWGFMQRVLGGLVLWPPDEACLRAVLSELFK